MHVKQQQEQAELAHIQQIGTHVNTIYSVWIYNYYCCVLWIVEMVLQIISDQN